MKKRVTKILFLSIAVFAVIFTFIACGNTAVLNVNYYTVTYVIEDGVQGAVPTESAKTTGEKFIIKSGEDLVNCDKVFFGWSDGSQTYQAGDEYTMQSNDVVFTAQWNDNADNPDNNQDGDDNKSDDDENKEDSKDPLPTENTKPIIKFNANGGTGNDPVISETDIVFDEAKRQYVFKLPQNTFVAPEGKMFDVWAVNNVSNTYSAGQTYNIDSGTSITLIAVWKSAGNTPDLSINHSVIYDLNGGTGTVPSESDKTAGESFVLAEAVDFSYDDREFVGWDDGATLYVAGAEYTMPDCDVTFTAQWKDKEVEIDVKYTVTVVKSADETQIPFVGGDIPSIEDKAAGETFVILNVLFTLQHYSFTEWCVQVLNDSGDWDTVATYNIGETITMPSNDVRIAPVWIINKVVISFNANGGIGQMDNLSDYDYDSIIVISENGSLSEDFLCRFTYDGMDFVGWSTAPNGNVLTASVILDENIVTEYSLVLYAVWEEIAPPAPEITIEGITGQWSNKNNELIISADNLDKTDAAGCAVLNGIELFYVIVGEVSYIISIDNSSLYVLSYSGLSITITSDDGTAIIFDDKRDMSDCSIADFVGKWSRRTASNPQPLIITEDKAYYNQALAYADVTTIGKYCAIYSQKSGSVFAYVLEIVDKSLIGYYINQNGILDNVEFNVGEFAVLTVCGVFNQIVNIGCAPDVSRIIAPTAPENKELVWVVEGSSEVFDITAEMTADVSIVYIYKDIEAQPTTNSVTYDLNGGVGTLPTETDKVAGEKFFLAAVVGFSNGDKIFIGWSDGITTYAADAEYTMPTNAVTFTAQWQDKIITIRTYVGTAVKENGRISQIVIDSETGEIIFTYLPKGAVNTATKQVTAEIDECGYFITADNPTGEDLWIVVSDDGSTVTLYNDFDGEPDEQLGEEFDLQA